MLHTQKELEIVKLSNAAENEKTFRHLFSKFADKTSMVGVPYIDMARFWWAKLIWAFLLLAAVSAMSLHLWYLFSHWYSYPKTTKVSLGYSHLSIPQITVCNINALHRGRFEGYTGAKDLKTFIDSVRPKNSGPLQETTSVTTSFPNGDIVPTLNEALSTTDIPMDNADATPDPNSLYPNDDDNEDDFGMGTFYYGANETNATKFTNGFTSLYMDINMTDRAWLGHQINDMLQDCTFNGKVCDASLFKLHQTSGFGNCWTISSKEFTVTKPGPKGGLSLELFLENNEYIRGITHGYGIRIDVKQRNTHPFPAEEGMFIPAAMETDIGLRLLRVERLGGNYGKCNTGVEFKQLYNFTYTRRACQTVCQITEVIDKCGCFTGFEELSRKINDTVTPCRTSKDINCMKKVEQNFIFDELTCECENPCKEIAYIKSVSQRQWPTYEDATVALKRLCKQDPKYCLQSEQSNTSSWDLNLNFLKVNIYFEDLNYEDLKEEPQIEFQQLLSDVGGAIGLWIGLSILSLCELLQLAVELLHFAVRKTVSKRNKQRLEQTADERRGKWNIFSRLHRSTKVQMINT